MSTRPVALVTGANKGIGLQVAKDLFAKGYSVVLGCRDIGKGRGAMTEIAMPYEDEIMEEGHKLTVIKLDLNDPATIPAAVEEYQKFNDRLDVLVNNAGVYTPDVKGTFAVNFFSTMAVTEAFIPLLAAPKAKAKTADAATAAANTSGRIVIVSSRMGQHASTQVTGDALAAVDPADPADIDVEKLKAIATAYVNGDANTGYKAGQQYAVSKSLISAYGRALAVRLEKKDKLPITVNVTCPGYTKTDLTNNQGIKTVAQGAETITWVATDPSFDNVTGKFFGDHKEMAF